MNTTAEVLPYYEPRVEGLTSILNGSWLSFEEVSRTIVGGTSLEWQELVSFFLQFDHVVARLEFFHFNTPGGEYRGVVIYDTLGSPLVHCPAAIMGTDGSNGYDLSRKILMRLGVLESDIVEVNQRVHSYRHKPVVFSRETFVGNPKSVVLGAPVQNVWNWWFTEQPEDD